MTVRSDPFRNSAFFAGFLAATAFLTVLPVDPRERSDWRLADSAWAFPLVGAGIGVVAGLAFLMAQLLGLGTLPAALLAVLASLALSGALHEDGLADSADGFCGGHDSEEKLAIMRDSQHGTFGVLAIASSVLLRAAALATIGDVIHAGLALIAAHAASRATLPIAMRAMHPARAGGLGVAAGVPRLPSVVGAVMIGILVALTALGPPGGLVALCLAAVANLAVGRVAQRQIGGYTGDVLGALQQTTEIVMLLAASAR